MAQDVTKGRRTEIDYMNGHVVAKGRERGVPTPVSAAVVDIMREIERARASRRRRTSGSRCAAPASERSDVESDLYAPVKAFLEAQGYEVKGEVTGCDVVATRGGEPPVIVELKLAFSSRATPPGHRSPHDGPSASTSRWPGRGDAGPGARPSIVATCARSAAASGSGS